MKKVRLYIEQQLSEDITLTLNNKQSHYINNVMRMKCHDNIYLFNGKDGEWLSKIINQSSQLSQIKIKECVKAQEHEKSLSLCCAVVKAIALNNIIRQSTEIGVTRIQFILTQYTIVRYINLDRIKLQVIEAAEQCGRTSIPEVLAPITLDDLLKLQNQNFILCDSTGKTSDKILQDKKETSVIIGPEGGFSNNELNFTDSSCQKLSLGKRILRVDTAVVAALTLLSRY